jgi:hypothetical protein
MLSFDLHLVAVQVYWGVVRRENPDARIREDTSPVVVRCGRRAQLRVRGGRTVAAAALCDAASWSICS